MGEAITEKSRPAEGLVVAGHVQTAAQAVGIASPAEDTSPPPRSGPRQGLAEAGCQGPAFQRNAGSSKWLF